MDISSLMRLFSLLHQLYADDIQAYIHCNAADAVASVGLMCSAIDVLSRWMASNRLLLSSDIFVLEIIPNFYSNSVLSVQFPL